MSTEFPLRHLSVRVPWHDAGWAGIVCQAPHLNGACAKLKGIAGRKNDADELALAGKSLEELPVSKWPCCVDERAAFMAPFTMDHVRHHALADKNSEKYGHFKDTRQRYPPFSAGIVPFRWLMRDNLAEYADLYELDADRDREPDLGYTSTWVHEAENQKTLLDAFAAHLRKDDSLCFFYSKHVPFVEGTGRILVGAGRVADVGKLIEYDRHREGMRGMVWERPVQHSIRPKGKDGFIFPYLEILKRVEADPSIDIDRYTARAPEDHWDEFSFGSELVTHDGAIAAALALESALGRVEAELGISSKWQREWLNEELVRLWKVRGPFPGLGAVLAAFGMSRGIFVAHAIQKRAGDSADPWPLVDEAFRKPADVLPKDLTRDLKELAPTWKGLPAERREFLKLLSRFELTKRQAKSFYDAASRDKEGWQVADKDVLRNPYRLYEVSRHHPDGLQLLGVDRGIFPDDSIRLKHPLIGPAALDSAVDMRRVRAFTVATLEEAATRGHTLLPFDQIVDGITGKPVMPACPVTGDILAARGSEMEPEIAVSTGNQPSLQLARYVSIGDLVRKQVSGRVAGQRHTVTRDWRKLVDQTFPESADAIEALARAEKAAALKELAESRLSVLVGPAGAGKTTVLRILCEQPEVLKEGVLLLAPTGKARVRLQSLAGLKATQALTIAQFLNQHGRYDGESGRYFLSDRPRATGFGTVVVDESSMLTEDMLGALFDALQGVKRFILVGDPAQLPPIGAGRPFVDIVSHLRPPNYESMSPRVASGYGELTIERRQKGKDRPDVRFARWFSATPPPPGQDDVFACEANEHQVRFVEWDKPEDFPDLFLKILVEELRLASADDLTGFNKCLGSVTANGYEYFNACRGEKKGSVDAVEDWQVLTPLRGMPFGVGDINRQIHGRFRRAFLDFATRQWRSIPKPMGPERIVYGDKVINVRNHRRDGKRVYPAEGALGYVANGEIGLVVGQWKSRGSPKIVKVEFASQKGYTYDFYSSDFREEGEAALELAYALTVHKAQGSQFKLVILVVPRDHPILSRELIYTAVTRQEERVVIMHQGPRTVLKDFAAVHRSETARRMTNLLRPCLMVEVPLTKGSVFLQEGLVHRTKARLAVRSKSELIIADALTDAGYRFEYEKPLTLGGITRYPDFTIEDEISGKTLYWEHLGLLHRADYKRSWEKKQAWYQANGVVLAGAKTPAGAPLLVTTSEEKGFDSGMVQRVIKQHLQN